MYSKYVMFPYFNSCTLQDLPQYYENNPTAAEKMFTVLGKHMLLWKNKSDWDKEGRFEIDVSNRND